MKARNKLEKRAESASRHLPSLTSAQIAWAKEHLFKHTAYCSGRRSWCGDCGATFDADTEVCPCCGHRLTIEPTRRIGNVDKRYYTIVTTCKGMQVIRTFIAIKRESKGKQATHYFNEVIQLWFDEQGSKTIRACNRVQSYFCDLWQFGTMSTKREIIYGYNVYDIEGIQYPRYSVLPIIKRNGYRPLPDVTNGDLISILWRNPKAETLIKAGQHKLLAHLVNGRWNVNQDWDAVKIAIRHGYIVSDATLWCDMISDLRYLGKDTHNPIYVCPADLKAAHDKVTRQADEQRRRAAAERKAREAREAEPRYLEAKGKYLALLIVSDGITIRPLQSVAEFAEEGKAMHHCVFSNGYYKKADALILTARTQDGQRLETIEVNLKTYKIVQSRAVCNGTSPQHDAIVSLVERSMNKIKAIKCA